MNLLKNDGIKKREGYNSYSFFGGVKEAIKNLKKERYELFATLSTNDLTRFIYIQFLCQKVSFFLIFLWNLVFIEDI